MPKTSGLPNSFGPAIWPEHVPVEALGKGSQAARVYVEPNPPLNGVHNHRERPEVPMLRRIQALLKKPDLRKHPVRGTFRRVVWHLRWWLFPNKPWLLLSHGSIPLLTVRGGVGALIYYLGSSEPDIADFIERVLKPGMVFVDIGAHLGEYTLLAAKILEHSGQVYAFEPRPDIFKILKRNIELNACRNVSAHPHAVWCMNDLCDLEMTPEPAVSALCPRGPGRPGVSHVKVQAISLDDWFSSPSLAKPNLIKVDVEGAELQVLQGAKSLLTLPPSEAPALIFEYGTDNSERFNYSASEILTFLRKLGYTIYNCLDARFVRVDGDPTLPKGSATCNCVAVKVLEPASLEFKPDVGIRGQGTVISALGEEPCKQDALASDYQATGR